MQICTSASRPIKTTTPALQHSVFYRPDAIPATQLTATKHWRFLQESWQKACSTFRFPRQKFLAKPLLGLAPASSQLNNLCSQFLSFIISILLLLLLLWHCFWRHITTGHHMPPQKGACGWICIRETHLIQSSLCPHKSTSQTVSSLVQLLLHSLSGCSARRPHYTWHV